jgi:hypothetical protein
MAHHDGMSETAMGAAFENAELDKYKLKDISHAKLMGKDIVLFIATGYYRLLTRAYKLRILREISPKVNPKDSRQGTLLVALIDDNIKLARRS